MSRTIAGRLGPQCLLFCAGLMTGFGVGYWFAKSESEEADIEKLKANIQNIESEINLHDYTSNSVSRENEFNTALDDEKNTATTSNDIWSSLHKIT
jgi:hypothetical protein